MLNKLILHYKKLQKRKRLVWWLPVMLWVQILARAMGDLSKIRNTKLVVHQRDHGKSLSTAPGNNTFVASWPPTAVHRINITLDGGTNPE